MSSIVFIDSEISVDSKKILDLGAVKPNNDRFHSPCPKDFVDFVSGSDFICGHNIVAHDLQYIAHIFEEDKIPCVIDTLPLSPLLFPCKPYHALLKAI